MEESGASLHGFKKFAAALAHVLKSSVVLIVALVAAGITCFFVPFDEEYLG